MQLPWESEMEFYLIVHLYILTSHHTFSTVTNYVITAVLFRSLDIKVIQNKVDFPKQ